MHPDLFEQYEASLEAAKVYQKLGNQSGSPVTHVQMKMGIQMFIVIYYFIIILHFDAAEKIVADYSCL